MKNETIDQPIASTETKPAKHFNAKKMAHDLKQGMIDTIESANEAKKTLKTLLEVMEKTKIQKNELPKDED